jgi:hypothetical protein
MVRQRVGFFERIGRGWKMTKLGIAVVRADPELMVYTFLSAVFSIVASIAVITSSIGIEMLTESETTSSQQDEALTVANLGFIFVGYLIISVITVFWNAAIVASAYERLTAGTNPSFSYGIKQASKCLPQIFVWGIIRYPTKMKPRFATVKASSCCDEVVSDSVSISIPIEPVITAIDATIENTADRNV